MKWIQNENTSPSSSSSSSSSFPAFILDLNQFNPPPTRTTALHYVIGHRITWSWSIDRSKFRRFPFESTFQSSIQSNDSNRPIQSINYQEVASNWFPLKLKLGCDLISVNFSDGKSFPLFHPLLRLLPRFKVQWKRSYGHPSRMVSRNSPEAAECIRRWQKHPEYLDSFRRRRPPLVADNDVNTWGRGQRRVIARLRLNQWRRYDLKQQTNRSVNPHWPAPVPLQPAPPHSTPLQPSPTLSNPLQPAPTRSLTRH